MKYPSRNASIPWPPACALRAAAALGCALALLSACESPPGASPSVPPIPLDPLAHVRHERDATEARLAQAAEAEDDDAAGLIRMNRQLGEEPHSLQFYDTLAPDNPARVFLARQLVRQLVTQRRYADAVLGWDVREVNRLFNSSARTLTGADSKAAAAGPEHQHLLLQFLDYYEALVGAGDPLDAQTLAGRIGDFDSSPGTLVLLQTRATRAGHPELPTTKKRGQAVAVVKPVSRLTQFKQKMASPAFRAEVAAQAKGRLDAYYGFLFQEFNLPADQLDRCKDLLVQRQIAIFDAGEAATKRGATRPPGADGRNDAIAEGAQAIEAELASLLGADRYGRYRDYEFKFSRWFTACQLADALRSTPTPLTLAQARRLVDVLYERTPGDVSGLSLDITKGIGLMPAPFPNRPDATVRTKAEDFLSPPQLAALHRLEQRQEVDWDEEDRAGPEDPAPLPGESVAAGTRDEPRIFEGRDVDHIPTLVDAVLPIYPAGLESRGISAQVLVDFLVYPDGTVKNARVLSSLQPEFSAAAITAVSQWLFTPGRRGGRTVITHMNVPVVFQPPAPSDGQ